MGFPMGGWGVFAGYLDKLKVRTVRRNKMDFSKIDFNSRELSRERKMLSKEEIEYYLTRNYGGDAGFSTEMLNRWGVPYPPPKGWRTALIKYGYPLLELEIIVSPEIKKLAMSMTKKNKKKSAKPKKHVPSLSEKKSFYDSWEWRTLRMKTIKKYGAICQCCGATPGMMTAGSAGVRIVVDHIKPISKYWELRLAKSNVQILCDECNMGVFGFSCGNFHNM